uniref:Uncharacterized protein n=1 Tax=Aegilops tauschii TaxID=37682 RepID=M8BMQ6_AEGTA
MGRYKAYISQLDMLSYNQAMPTSNDATTVAVAATARNLSFRVGAIFLVVEGCCCS